MRTIARLVRAIASVTSASAVAVVLVAAPARAATGLHVDVRSGLGSLSVCVSGTASVPGDFQLSIEGARSNGSRISDSVGALNTLSYAKCRTVDKLGASYGDFVVTFRFTSGLVSTEDNVADGAGGWAVGFNDLTIGSG